jgi:hypothetical protein
MSDSGISRRGALKYLGMLSATLAGRRFLASWLPMQAVHGDENRLVSIGGMHHQEAETETPEPYTPQFFKPEEFKTVELLTSMIIPTDEAPGAKEARVAEYVDFVVFSAAEFRPALQKDWIIWGVRARGDSGRVLGRRRRRIA